MVDNLRIQERYDALKSQRLALNLTRGKPASAQLELSAAMLSLPGPQEVEAVVVGPDGVLTAEPVPRYVVDLSTNAVPTVRALRAR